jgi:hypothetical protein
MNHLSRRRKKRQRSKKPKKTRKGKRQSTKKILKSRFLDGFTVETPIYPFNTCKVFKNI